jgi:hypothetical protein
MKAVLLQAGLTEWQLALDIRRNPGLETSTSDFAERPFQYDSRRLRLQADLRS